MVRLETAPCRSASRASARNARSPSVARSLARIQPARPKPTQPAGRPARPARRARSPSAREGEQWWAVSCGPAGCGYCRAAVAAAASAAAAAAANARARSEQQFVSVRERVRRCRSSSRRRSRRRRRVKYYSTMAIGQTVANPCNGPQLARVAASAPDIRGATPTN